MATNQRIRYELEAAVSGEQDVAALARQLEGLADTLEGDLKVQAQASAQALRELGAKQGAIDNFVKLKSEAGDAAARLREAQGAAQQLGQAMAASGAPTRAQAGQLEKLRDAVRSAKTEVLEKTRALDNSRATLRSYGVASDQVAASERATRSAIAQARSEVSKLAPAYTAAGNAAAASGRQQQQSAQATTSALAGIGQTLRSIQSIALTAVGGTFLTSLARDVGAVADQYNNLRARISLVTGDGPALEAAFDAVRQIALSTGSALETTADLFTRVYRAGKEVGLSQQQALQLTETINKAIQVSGGSAQAADAAITQLIQGLQGGVLRGQEFNSVMEQAPRLAQALSDGLSVTTGELRKMANEGRLTSDVVLTALQGQAQAVADEFSKLPPTIGRALENLSTNWTNYVGNVDKGTAASQAAARAINAIGDNFDNLVGFALRAASALETAWGVMTAGANGVLTVVYKLGELFTSVAGGIQRSISDILTGLSKISFGDLSKNFAQAAAEMQTSADATFAAADALGDSARSAFLRMAEGAQTARDGWAALTSEAVQSAGAVTSSADSAVESVEKIGQAAEQNARYLDNLEKQITESLQARAVANRFEAQAAEANLRVQLQLARQSEEMARFMGDENAVRAAKIQQYEIEIQLAEAKVAVSRAEAEGAIAVAQAKIAEMDATKSVDLVKRAELEGSIKLAQAKLAEAEATGQATELMRRQLEQFRSGASAADGLGRSLDGAAQSQRRFSGETQAATQAVQEQIGWLDRLQKRNSEVKSNLATDGQGFATDATGGRLVAGGDLTTLTGITNFLKQAGLTDEQAKSVAREFSDGRGNIPYFSNPGQKKYGGEYSTISDALLKAAERVTFGIGSAGGQSIGGQPSQSAQASDPASAAGSGRASGGRTVNINLSGGGSRASIPTTEAGAADLVRVLRRAGLSARA